MAEPAQIFEDCLQRADDLADKVESDSPDTALAIRSLVRALERVGRRINWEDE